MRKPNPAEQEALWFLLACALLGTGGGILYGLLGRGGA